MRGRVRLGLCAVGVLLGVLLFAGLVWRAEGVTITRAIQQPDVPTNAAIVTLHIGELPWLHVYPGANVEIKCTADNTGESIAFACTARQRVRAK